MKETTEQRLNKARVFALASRELLPLIEERKQAALDLLIRDYREGSTSLLAQTAKLEAYIAILEDIQSHQDNFQTLIEKHNQENNS